MKLTEHIYMLSGVPYGTNSNTYAIEADGQIILIDAGYSALQWNRMQETLKDWGLARYPVTHLFLTHVHFDHAGNAHLAKEAGTKVLIGEGDATALKTANECTLTQFEEVFPDTFIPCVPDAELKPGDFFRFGDVQLEVIDAAGHSCGSLMFLVRADGKRILFTGDNVTIGPEDARDDIVVSTAFTGSPDCDVKAYLHTLERAAALSVDILAPGHYYPYYGDVSAVFSEAAELLKQEKPEIFN